MNGHHAQERPWWQRRRYAVLVLVLLALAAVLVWRYGDGDLRALDRAAKAAGLPVPGDADWYQPRDPTLVSSWVRLDEEAERITDLVESRLAGAATASSAPLGYAEHWRQLGSTIAVSRSWRVAERTHLVEHLPRERLDRWWQDLREHCAASAAVFRGFV